MIGIFSGLKMAFFGVIAAAVIGGWLYVKGLQKDLAVAKENMIKLEGAVSEQKRVIEQQRIDFEAIVEANKKLSLIHISEPTRLLSISYSGL